MEQTLKGQRILVTRAKAQASTFSRELAARGASVIECPTIQIRPRPQSEIDAALQKLTDYDWLFLTSTNGADIFLGRAVEIGIDADTEGLPHICTIGPATAKAARKLGFKIDVVPETYQAEGILEEFLGGRGGNLEQLKILLPRASQAREILPDQLRSSGAIVDVVAVYDTILPEAFGEQLRRTLSEQLPDMVTFTSSSTVHNFVKLCEGHPRLPDLQCASIGPITSDTARSYGLKVVLEPEKSTIPYLVLAMESFFSSHPAERAH